MQSQCFHRVFHICVAIIILYASNASVLLDISSDGEQSRLGAHIYYERHLHNLTKELSGANRDNHLLRRKLEAINYRMDREVDVGLKQLLEIKKLLEERVKIKPKNVKAPTSCAEAMQSNADHKHGGVYRLHLPHFPPFDVFCLRDPDNGPAWTIIQRRQDGTMNFYLKWADYKNGFGNLYDEYWLGLDRIHELTKIAKQELWILLEDFEGERRYAKYSNFAIGNERSKYTLNKLGTYSGDAGDALNYHLQSKFSTKDSDNDNNATNNCAVRYTGAWWFNKCFHCDLNGKYLRNGVDSGVQQAEGIDWYLWRGHYYSLKHVHMAIRPLV